MLSKCTVQESFDIGLIAVKHNQDYAEANKFVLVEPHSLEPVPIFDDISDGKWTNVTDNLPQKLLPSRIPHMLGRQIEMQRLFEALCQGRLVCQCSWSDSDVGSSMKFSEAKCDTHDIVTSQDLINFCVCACVSYPVSCF